MPEKAEVEQAKPQPVPAQAEQDAPSPTDAAGAEEGKADVKLEGKMAEFVDWIETISVLELSQLVKALEDRLGVSATAPVAAMAGVAAGGGAQGDGGAAAEEVQTEFTVVLTDFGAQKIQVIKEVRAITGLGLKESKEVVEGAPKPIKEGVSKDEAAQLKEKLEAAGAKVEIK